MRRQAGLVSLARQMRAAVLLLGLAACSGSEGAGATGPEGPAPGTAGATTSLADLVEVDQVAVYQSVKVTVLDDAAPLTPNAPLVANRPGLVRVHARVLDRTAKRPEKLDGELRVLRPGREDLVARDYPKRLVALADANLESTFNFELPKEAFVPGAKLSFTLKSPAKPEDPGIGLPGGEALALDVKDAATTLKVRLVPIRYDADGSKRTPSLDERQVAFYRDSLYKLYPVEKVDLTVREAVPWPLAVAGDGEGWDALLDRVIKLRAADGVPDDVYYAAVFTPAEDMTQYCQGGCIMGVAPAQRRSEVGLRVAMIVGFGLQSEGGTLAQEIAHAMGRLHAPCGMPDAIDRRYPYEGGGLGAWGWDPLAKELISPEEHYDFMSYCSPVWVSDYTYAALLDEAARVQAAKRPEAATSPAPTDANAAGASAAPRLTGSMRVRSVLVGPTGELAPGADVEVVTSGAETPADGSEIDVTFVDERGKALGTTRARLRTTTNLAGGRLLLPPDAGVPAGAVRVRTRDVDLARPLAPALLRR